ncbi:MAG: hypothetical protein ACI8P9_004159 [Parasphingorhabdus sp.]|jgi:hypothetical protein
MGQSSADVHSLDRTASNSMWYKPMPCIGLLSEVYDMYHVKRYDGQISTDPHFKITTIDQILNWLDPNVEYIEEVDFGSEEFLIPAYPGHSDGVFWFITYNGYGASLVPGDWETYQRRKNYHYISFSSKDMYMYCHCR